MELVQSKCMHYAECIIWAMTVQIILLPYEGFFSDIYLFVHIWELAIFWIPILIWGNWTLNKSEQKQVAIK